MALTKLEEILEDNLEYQFVEQGAIPSIKDCCRIYAQSQTQELIEQNMELVSAFKNILDFKKYQRVEDFISIEEMEELLTKYNHLKSNTYETDKI